MPGRGCYKENDVVKSKVQGIVRVKDNLVRVVPLGGTYVPQEGDKIIGEISNVGVSSWWVELNSPYEGFLSLSDGSNEFIDLEETELSDVYDIGDLVYAEVIRVTKGMDVKLSMDDRMCKQLTGGMIQRITPSKVPRLIGKGGSMVETIKNHTDTHIIIGQNGVVWLDGEKIDMACKAIQLVDKESHKKGLTDKVEKLLKEGE